MIEGTRSDSALSHFLPIIKPFECGHTAPLADASATVRVLHSGPPKSGVRLIGSVYRGAHSANRDSRTPLGGVTVSIQGPRGAMVSTTDAEGVYDEHGLPPGRYTLHLMLRDANVETSYGTESPSLDLKIGEVGGADFYIR
ncbi:MAG TPA: carboxypeptidase-like regulatory domain-containing protein [Bryobacteraceae bacterium]|nr:carboxypeptidase-like regulatory domain-containing protein [Bryobacteraceae bacterium]